MSHEFYNFAIITFVFYFNITIIYPYTNEFLPCDQIITLK